MKTEKYYVMRDVKSLRRFLGSLPIDDNKVVGSQMLLDFVSYRFCANYNRLHRLQGWLCRHHPEIRDEFIMWMIKQDTRKKLPF